MTSDLANLRLFQLISPTLPIGSFTYSQGIEWSVEAGWISNPENLSEWLESVLKDSLVWLELPILLRLYDACKNNDAIVFNHWSQQLLASRESKELRQEELNRARALLTVLNKLPEASSWPELREWRDALLNSQVSSFALAAKYWGIDHRQTLLGYVWSWLENAVTVAVKLIPLGQSDGQITLHSLSSLIPDAIDVAMSVDDDDIGASTPALAIASSLHEAQYTRLFRS